MAERDQDSAARLAAEAVERGKTVAAQLCMFDAPKPAEPAEPEKKRGPGRPAGSRNKARSGLAEYFQAMGYTDPATKLALAAGLNSSQNPWDLALERATVILAASGADAKQIRNTLGRMVVDIQREQRQAADALMPYLFAKKSPDEGDEKPALHVTISAPGGAAVSAGRRAGPPPMPQPETVENQGVIDADAIDDLGEGG